MTPDFKKNKPRLQRSYDEYDPEELAVEAAALRAFMETVAARDDAKAKCMAQFSTPSRLSNWYAVTAMDHTMKASLGLDLSWFMDDNYIGPLRPHEERYYADSADFPTFQKVGQTDPDDRKRSCIKNNHTGEKRLELPLEFDENGNLDRKSFHQVVDRGSTGWPNLCWQYHKVGVRGTQKGDLLHDIHNEFKNAATDSNIWICVLERVLLGAAVHGPFDGQTVHQQVKGCGVWFFSTFTSRHEIFLMHFDRICRRWKSFPLEYGSERHGDEI